jgi:hypothetical protein
LLAKFKFFFTTEAQRAQREILFLPDRETAIRQKKAALRARWALSIGEAGGFFSLAAVSRPGKIRVDSSVPSVPLW